METFSSSLWTESSPDSQLLSTLQASSVTTGPWNGKSLLSTGRSSILTLKPVVVNRQLKTSDSDLHCKPLLTWMSPLWEPYPRLLCLKIHLWAAAVKWCRDNRPVPKPASKAVQLSFLKTKIFTVEQLGIIHGMFLTLTGTSLSNSGEDVTSGPWKELLTNRQLLSANTEGKIKCSSGWHGKLYKQFA